MSVFVVSGADASGGGPRVGLRYKTAPGVVETRIADYGPWLPSTALPTRLVTLEGEPAPVLQKVVTSQVAAGDPHAFARLENEIRALVRLRRRYGSARPAELPRFLGYDEDTEEPFVLVGAPSGRPVHELAGQLMMETQSAFEVGLLRALRLLGEAGVVHGRLGPETVWCDGPMVQVADLGAAGVHGESRPAWAEAASHPAIADTAEDVWSAGILIHYVETGELPAGVPALLPGTRLAMLLDGVFGPAADRPSATVLLQRSRAETAVPAGTLGPDAAFVAGQRRFDEVRAEKAGPPPTRAPQRPPVARRTEPVATRRADRGDRRTAVLIGIFAVVLVMVALGFAAVA